VLEPRLQQHRAGDGAALGDPQAAQAQRGQGHRLHVAGPLGELVGLPEVLPAGPQVAVDVQRAGPVRERGLEFCGPVSGVFQASGPRVTGLTRHRHNVFAADIHRRGRRRGLTAALAYLFLVRLARMRP
jgi:hypothetical protein